MGTTCSCPRIACCVVALGLLAACSSSTKPTPPLGPPPIPPPTKPSLYVAVGTGGVMYSSTDGAAWSPALGGTGTSHLYGLAWNGRAYAAVGAGGALLSSTDGKNWIATVYSGHNTLNGVAAHGGVFCAVGSSGLFLRSENDGADWTDSHVVGLTANLLAVAWTGSAFTAVGWNGVTATSPDCATWTQTATVSGSPNLLDVAAFGSRVVALGSDGKLHASEDGGASWTGHAIGSGFNLWVSLATDETTLFVAGFENMAGPRISSSTNLTDWTQVFSDPDWNRALYAIHWDGTRYLAAGANGFQVTSTDATGQSWTPGSVATTTETIYGLAHQ